MYFLVTIQKTAVIRDSAPEAPVITINMKTVLHYAFKNSIHIFKFTCSFMYPQQISPPTEETFCSSQTIISTVIWGFECKKTKKKSPQKQKNRGWTSSLRPPKALNFRKQQVLLPPNLNTHVLGPFPRQVTEIKVSRYGIRLQIDHIVV